MKKAAHFLLSVKICLAFYSTPEAFRFPSECCAKTLPFVLAFHLPNKLINHGVAVIEAKGWLNGCLFFFFLGLTQFFLSWLEPKASI